MSQRKERLEAKLKPQQRKAAQLLVANEFGELGDGKKTMEEIAQELGIARSTLYEWKKDEVFIAYMNYLSDRDLAALQSEAYGALLKLIRGHNGIPSVKALDLYMRRFGLLTDRQVIEESNGKERRYKTDAEIDAELSAIDDLLNDE